MFDCCILNRLAKPYVFLAQTVFRLAVNLDLESDCQTRWFISLKLFIVWRHVIVFICGFILGDFVKSGLLFHLEMGIAEGIHISR